MPASQKRIKLTIQMPSVALLRFIEKVLQDDKVFESAIENPVAAMKESGVRLNISKFTPADLATFFGALAGVRELIKKKQIKDITFGNIFGHSAEVRGTTILAETQKGMWTQFERNALVSKQMYASATANFETLQLGQQDVQIYKGTTQDVSVRQNAFTNVAFSGIGDPRNIKNIVDLARSKSESEIAETQTSQGTDRGVTFHFDANQGIGSKTSSSIDTYTTKNFSGVSVFDPSILEQILNGPLINPGDLAAISAQINTYVQVSEQME